MIREGHRVTDTQGRKEIRGRSRIGANSPTYDSPGERAQVTGAIARVKTFPNSVTVLRSDHRHLSAWLERK